MKIAKISLEASSNQEDGLQGEGYSPSQGYLPSYSSGLGPSEHSKAHTAVDFGKNSSGGEKSASSSFGSVSSYSPGASFGADSNGNAHHDELFSQLSAPPSVRSIGALGRAALLMAALVGVFFSYNYFGSGRTPTESIFHLIDISSGDFSTVVEPGLLELSQKTPSEINSTTSEVSPVGSAAMPA